MILVLKPFVRVCVGVFALGAMLTQTVSGVILELGPRSAGYATETQVVNGAVFSVDTIGAGTGVFEPFLRVQRHGNATTAVGHNSDFKPENDEKYGRWHHSLQLFSVPIRELTAADYSGTSFEAGAFLEVRFDMNRKQNAGSTKEMNFAGLQFWVSEQPLGAHYDFSERGGLDPASYEARYGAGTSGLGTLAWDLDAGGDKNLIVGQSNQGSGHSDGVMYIPLSALANAAEGLTSDFYLTLWVELVDVNAGFDEFSVGEGKGPGGPTYLEPGTAIPEPGHYALIFGLVLLAGLGFRAKRQGV